MKKKKNGNTKHRKRKEKLLPKIKRSLDKRHTQKTYGSLIVCEYTVKMASHENFRKVPPGGLRDREENGLNKKGRAYDELVCQ